MVNISAVSAETRFCFLAVHGAHQQILVVCVCSFFGVKIQVDIGQGRQECDRWEGRGGGHQVFVAMAAWLAEELVEVKARAAGADIV